MPRESAVDLPYTQWTKTIVLNSSLLPVRYTGSDIVEKEILILMLPLNRLVCFFFFCKYVSVYTIEVHVL